MKNKIDIEFDIESIVKLACMHENCKHNHGGTCNLKHIELDKIGMCCHVERYRRVSE